MNMSSSAGEERNHQLVKIARLYFVNEFNQREIARKLNISIASVSRALSRAKQLGIVQITIDDPSNGLGEIEVAMERRWSLNECIVVPDTETTDEAYQRMALRVTEMLSRILNNGDTIGVSWGDTLKGVGEHLGDVGLSNTEVVPIIGAMGTVETGIYPNSIAKEYAERIGGTPYLMNTPAVVDSEEIRNSLQKDRNFQMVRSVWNRLHAALLSVSSLEEDTSAYREGIFRRDELHEIRNLGGICATNFSILDENGNELDTPLSRRITNLPFQELKNVRHVVVIAAGGKKVAPLRAALRTGIITTLVTDRECAEALLGSD